MCKYFDTWLMLHQRLNSYFSMLVFYSINKYHRSAVLCSVYISMICIQIVWTKCFKRNHLFGRINPSGISFRNSCVPKDNPGDKSHVKSCKCVFCCLNLVFNFKMHFSPWHPICWTLFKLWQIYVCNFPVMQSDTFVCSCTNKHRSLDCHHLCKP